MLKTIRKLSIVVGILALLTVILLNFMPVLNIKLTGVESDYTFGAAGGQNFVGRQCIFYWWGPSIYIGGVFSFNFNIVLCIGMLLPLLTLLVTTPMLIRARYKKKAVLEFVSAGTMVISAVIFLNATRLAETTVGNHLASYMKMAKEEGTYTLGYWVYVMVGVFAVASIFKIVSGVLSLKNEEEAAKKAAEELAAKKQDKAWTVLRSKKILRQ